jgi:hypothetical protein
MNMGPITTPNDEPNENSPLEELGAFALLKQNGIIYRDKINGEDMWLMGQALEWAYTKIKISQDGWEKWWKAQGLKKTYVWQARTLHKEATINQVQKLGLTEALRKFNVIGEKPKPPEPDISGLAGDEKIVDLADEAEKEFKEMQDSLRTHTLHDRAVAIQHSLEMMLEELTEDEIDQKLHQTFILIAGLVAKLKRLHKTT